jgi:release factor glutamine methyltransferase
MKSNTPELKIGDWLLASRQEMAGCLDESEMNLSLQVLLANVLGQTRAWVLAHPEAAIHPSRQAVLRQCLDRLREGVPLPYILGYWEFYGRQFEVNPAVLIPRPETELLVEFALQWLEERMQRLSLRPAGRFVCADAGTGSGCIAVSLAANFPPLYCIAVDLSWTALQVARRNAELNHVADRVHFLHSDLLTACAGPFDLVCANLPYIPEEFARELPIARHEPMLAIQGGSDGLQFIRALLYDSPRWIAPGGLILLEMQYDQGEWISQIARTMFSQAKISILPDLSGLLRIVVIDLSETWKAE